MHAIGRALVHLYNRQTAAEQAVTDTRETNFRGFAQCDARAGSLSARFYIKHRMLNDWQIELWRKTNVRGVSRLGKYWRQIAEEVEARNATR